MPKRLTEIIHNDFHLIGLTTNLKDYSLAWLFNENYNYSFVLDNNNQIFEKHSIFVSKNDNETICIIENKKSLFTELKQFDFLFLIFNPTNEIKSIIDSIKKLKDINFCFLIPNEKLKKKTIKTLQNLGL